MGFTCGIVGLPNVGKSTLFNALTAAKAEAANYPFCTIDPNVGIVKVPDPRLDEITRIVPTKQVVPAAMEFVDIAGLVKGASKGEGLGNKFLSHIREVQAVAHVVRCFADPNVVHVTGSVDPLRDIQIVDTELMLADLETVTKRYSSIEKAARAGVKEMIAPFAALQKVRTALEAGKPVRSVVLTEADEQVLREYHLLTEKKVLYLANVDDTDAANPGANPNVKAVMAHAAGEGALVVPICGKIESEIAELSPEEKLAFLKDFNMDEPGLNRVIRTGYELLGLQTFFTVGEKENRAWTIRKGWKAPQAAGVIHTDFEKGFIRAEVYHYDDLVRLKGETAVRDAGLMRSEGKEYVMRDGDVVHFRFAV